MSLAVQVQRFARMLQRRFGLQGYIPLAVLEELQPGFDILDPPLENRFLIDERAYMAGRTVAAVAAQFAWFRLENPAAIPGQAASDKLIVVERLDAISVTGTGMCILPPTTVGAVGSVIARDSRLGVGVIAQSSTTVTSGSGAVSQFQGLAIVFPRYSSSLDLGKGLVLAPGSALVVENQAVNEQLSVNAFWREVPLAPGELQGA